MALLSKKTKAEILHYWRKVETNVFDQGDFKELIITLRDFAPKASRVVEIGDFIAHPIRSKGSTHAHLSLFKVSQGGGSTEMLIPMGFDVDELLESLGDVLVGLKLLDSKVVRQTIKERSAELTLCLLGLLHHSTIQLAGQNALLTIVGLLHQIHSVQLTLELRAILDSGASLSLIRTSLQSSEWSNFEITEIEHTVNVRAIRETDGLKLRKF